MAMGPTDPQILEVARRLDERDETARLTAERDGWRCQLAEADKRIAEWIDRYDKVVEYVGLLEQGLSPDEARGTVWPDQGSEVSRDANMA